MLVEIPDVSGNTRGRILERWARRTGGRRKSAPSPTDSSPVADVNSTPETAKSKVTPGSAKPNREKMSKAERRKAMQELETQREKVKALKMAGASKEDIAPEVKKLLALKKAVGEDPAAGKAKAKAK